MENEKKQKQENVVAGVVGAFLGSLVGVACAVAVGQLGYVASVSGLVMAVGALKGYELLGGRLSKKGAAISSALVLAMTYLAHRLTWAFALMRATGAGVFDCFQAIPGLLEAGQLDGPAYWGDLAMLYLFTLLGAVPTMIGGLRGTAMPDLPQSAAAGSAAREEGDAPAEFYPGSISQMRPLRLSAAGTMFVGLLPGIVLLLVMGAGGGGYRFAPILGAMGCIAAAFVMMFFALPNVRLCYDALSVMVRAGGTVWKVKLTALNAADTYRFTKKTGALRALRWDILTPEEQAQAKTSIQRAISLLTSGQVMPGSALSLAVLPLTNLTIYDETKWAWKGTYSAGGGKEKKITLGKAYPGFAPLPGMEGVQGSVPPRWGLLALAVGVTAALGLLGGGFGYLLDRGASNPDRGAASPPPAQTASVPVESSYGGVTDAQAQDQFHLGTELGWEYTAVGYIKAPAGMFGQEGYVDVHVPYSQAPEYLDGGYGLRSAAHGMEVEVRIAQTQGNAENVVDLAYEQMASGVDVYEEGEGENHYFEDYDIAVRQVMFFEEDRTKVRVTVLYADYKQDGYYLSAAITYCPEQFDEAYPALLAELSDAYALELPVIPSMDGT